MRLAAFALATILPSLPALAQDPNAFRCPAPGTILELTNGAKIKFTASAPFECTYTNLASNRVFTDHSVFFTVKPLPEEGLTPEILAKVDTLWPLQAGKSVEVILNRVGQRYGYEFTVKPMERITVPAGTYDAWPIELVLTRIPGTSAASYTWWWSPQLGGQIKRAGRIIRGQWENVGSGYELLRVTPP